MIKNGFSMSLSGKCNAIVLILIGLGVLSFFVHHHLRLWPA
jgi:hypothetical protein